MSTVRSGAPALCIPVCVAPAVPGLPSGTWSVTLAEKRTRRSEDKRDGFDGRVGVGTSSAEGGEAGASVKSVVAVEVAVSVSGFAILKGEVGDAAAPPR